MEENLSTCLITLQNDPKIARTFFFMLNFVEEVSFLLAREMVATQKDISYWRTLSRLDPIVSRLFKSYINVYRLARNTFQPLEGEEDIDRNLIWLKSHFLSLAKSLATLTDTANSLKQTIAEFEVLNPVQIVNDRVVISDEVIDRCLSAARTRLLKSMESIISIFNEITCQAGNNPNSISRSFESLVNYFAPSQRRPSIGEVLSFITPSPIFRRNEIGEANQQIDDEDDDDFEMKSSITSIERLAQRLITSKHGSYPLESVRKDLRRPTFSEKYWCPALMLAIGTLFAGRQVYIMAKDGSLQQIIASGYNTVSKQTTERIVEPVTNLCRELFETISRRQEGMVTRADLEQSQQALARMLEDFLRAHKNGESGLSILSNPLQVILGNKGGSGAQGAQSPVAADPTVMELIMKQYEEDLRTPMTGLVFGTLMTTMLIQMQKMKVHTESALLTMDQVLASNQLTMAGTAAMPALLFFGATGLWLYRLVWPLPPKPGKRTARLRLFMSDVERSLVAVYGAPGTKPCAYCDEVRSRQQLTQQRLVEPEPVLHSQQNPRTQLSQPEEGLSSIITSTLTMSEASTNNGVSALKVPSTLATLPCKTSTLIEPLTNISQSDVTTSTSTAPTTSHRQERGRSQSFSMLQVFSRLSEDPNESNGYSLILPSARSDIVHTARDNTAECSAAVSTETKILESRGLLQFHLCRLRVELGVLFFHHTYRWGVRATLGAVWRRFRTWLNKNSSRPILPLRSVGMPNPVAALDSALDPVSHVVGVGGEDSEYSSLQRDVAVLAAPDWTMCGCKKLHTAGRMRVSYQCLVPPVQ